MEIKIKPKTFKGDDRWQEKKNGVVLVKSKDDVEPLWRLLCEQDEYWEHYKQLIKVAPEEIDHLSDLGKMCEYVGKTAIYELEKIREQIDFIFYQEDEEEYNSLPCS